jgi:16S rRNA (guanine527-N7)-methyltransferase
MIAELERAAERTVSRETFERLEAYVALLKKENQQQNLVSAATLDQIWERHVLDSAQLVRFEPHAGAAWADVGSGAGLPGIVVACLVDGPVTLIEPRRLRAEFLSDTVTALSLNAQVEAAKVERVRGTFDVITGRAVAPLPRFLEISRHLSTGKTVWALPKGRSAQSELADARRSWQGDFRVERSVTDEDSEIIVATGVRARAE